jgi:hypothetical protein
MIQAVSHSHLQDRGIVQVRTGPLPGRFPVSVCHFHAIDATRMDEQDRVPRQFMISAFYPAEVREGAVGARMVDVFEPAITEALEYLKAETKEKLVQNLQAIGLQSIRRGTPQLSAAPYPSFFDIHLSGANPAQLNGCIRRHPTLGIATQAAKKRYG